MSNEKFPLRHPITPTIPLPKTRTLEGQKIGYGQEMIKIEAIWEKYGRGKGVVIFIVDSVDSPDEHPDLLPRNYVELNNNFTGQAMGPDFSDHGLHCGGIAAAEDNTVGVVGSAPEALLGFSRMLQDNGSGALSWGVNALKWIADLDLGAINPDWKDYKKIASCSWGSSSGYTPLKEAVDYCFDKGVLVVAAAGNDPQGINYPGNYERVLTVASLGRDFAPSWFSSPYQNVDVSGIGEFIVSCIKGQGYGAKTGTSMAAPMVAALAACLWSRFKDLSADELRDYIIENAKDIKETGEGRDDKTGAGVVIADGYLENEPDEPDTPDEPDEPKPDKPEPVRPRNRNVILEFEPSIDIIYRRNNDDQMRKAFLYSFEAEVRSKENVEKLHAEMMDIIVDFFKRSSFHLMSYADGYDAVYYALYFLLLLRFKDGNFSILSANGKSDEAEFIVEDIKTKFSELSHVDPSIGVEHLPEDIRDLILVNLRQNEMKNRIYYT